MAYSIFSDEFLDELKSLILEKHHQIYPAIPPQGIYFENLVLRAFQTTLTPSERETVRLEKGGTNAPQPDLVIGEGTRLSIKSETGKGTRPDSITITKLLTTEAEPWTAESLVDRAIAHITRYNHLLMLRAVWQRKNRKSDYTAIRYQLVVIPMDLLESIRRVAFGEVGTRAERRSLGGDVIVGGKRLFRVHFDGSDRKCSVRGLLRERCVTLLEWDYPLTDPNAQVVAGSIGSDE